MQTTELYQNLFSYLTERLHILNDKPEETIENCLKVLWVKASGKNQTMENALSEKMVELSKDQVDLLHKLVHTRVSGVPLAYITGRQSFMGIELLCDKRALIPRKETELLGKTALKICRSVSKSKNNPLVIDVCCGSGNIGLALSVLSPGIQVFSSDLSQEAVNLTKENITFLNLENLVIVLQGALFEAFESDKFYRKVDVIVCNPPYISSAKVRNMEVEISENEPPIAFDGGMLGIKIIQQLIKEAPKYLINGGHLIFEVGIGQGTLIGQLCNKMNKYTSVKAIKDEKGNIRVIHCIF